MPSGMESATALTSPESNTRRARREAERRAARAAARLARRAARRVALRRAAMSGGAMLFAAAMAVGLSIPATATFGTATPDSIAASASTAPERASKEAVQTVEVAAAQGAHDESHAGERDAFSALSYAEIQQAQYQAAGGVAPGFIPTAGSVRWPFPFSSSISDGWGDRGWEFHQGVDFNPGEGTPIQAIADGVVTWVGWGNNGYGYYVMIAHIINGQRVDTLYGHMIDGSSSLYPGQEIAVGTEVGLVGNTGRSYGAHLHFEVHVEGTPVDPYAWLQANATNQ